MSLDGNKACTSQTPVLGVATLLFGSMSLAVLRRVRLRGAVIGTHPAAALMAACAGDTDTGDKVTNEKEESLKSVASSPAKLARAARKAAVKAAKAAKRAGKANLKTCSQCEKEAMKLYRCQVDATATWVFVCPACWPSVRCVSCSV